MNKFLFFFVPPDPDPARVTDSALTVVKPTVLMTTVTSGHIRPRHPRHPLLAAGGALGLGPGPALDHGALARKPAAATGTAPEAAAAATPPRGSRARPSATGNGRGSTWSGTISTLAITPGSPTTFNRRRSSRLPVTLAAHRHRGPPAVRTPPPPTPQSAANPSPVGPRRRGGAATPLPGNRPITAPFRAAKTRPGR